MGHKVIDNTQNTAVQDQLEALKQLKDRLASHTKFGFNLMIITWLFCPNNGTKSAIYRVFTETC